MSRTAGKLGKKPAQPRPKDFTLEEFSAEGSLLAMLPVAPVGFGHEGMIGHTGWGMLGNDEWGDCAWAGPAHETMMVRKMNGEDVPFTTEGVLADYAAGTGFDPNAGPPGHNPTDQGSDLHEVLEYRRTIGLVDANGKRHKIGAYVSLQPGHFKQTLQALRAFDFVGIGFLVPDYAMQQFSAGQPWTYAGPGTIEGGHYVPIVGRPHAWTLDVVTWGQTQYMTSRFFEHFNDESYGVLTEETLNAGGVTPEGLDLDKLNAALAAL